MQKAIETWYASAFGQQVLKAEQQQVEQLISDKFGYYVVEFTDAVSHFNVLSPIARKFSLSLMPNKNPQQSLTAELTALPFIPDSVDMIIMPHILEFIAEPEHVLEQVWTSLMPNGYVLIMSFNPYSLWGIYRKLKQDKKIPYQGSYFSSRKITSMLKSAGFHVDEIVSCSFTLPTMNQQSTQTHNRWLAFAQLAWPSSGNVNIILARKRLSGVTPLTIEWNVKKCTKPITEPGA